MATAEYVNDYLEIVDRVIGRLSKESVGDVSDILIKLNLVLQKAMADMKFIIDKESGHFHGCQTLSQTFEVIKHSLDKINKRLDNLER